MHKNKRRTSAMKTTGYLTIALVLFLAAIAGVVQLWRAEIGAPDTESARRSAMELEASIPAEPHLPRQPLRKTQRQPENPYGLLSDEDVADYLYLVAEAERVAARQAKAKATLENYSDVAQAVGPDTQPRNLQDLSDSEATRLNAISINVGRQRVAAQSIDFNAIATPVIVRVGVQRAGSG